MAGGHGTRLWPLSREACPKQFLTLSGHGRTLLQETMRRAVEVVGSPSRVLVVTQVNHAPLVREQLPELSPENLILEPVGRNTAACIGLAALHIHRRKPNTVMAVFPADHLFADEAPWVSAIRTAIAFASRTDYLVAIGIPPDTPSSNYGYLQLGQVLASVGECAVYEVLEFVEKPDVEHAKTFCEDVDHLWNTGTFAWRTSVIQEALKQCLPKLHDGLMKIGNDLDSWETLADVYSTFDNVSVDHGVLEKASGMAVVYGNFRRIDLGALLALSEIWPSDQDGNSIHGMAICTDSRGNIVHSDSGLIGLIGLEDMIVVRQKDVVLICPRSRAREVKQLVTRLRQEGLSRYL